MNRRIWLITYGRRGEEWSYDFNAAAIARHLSDRFEFRIAQKGTRYRDIRDWRAGLVVDFWWHGGAHVFGLPVLRQVSSHRWRGARYGSLSVPMLIDRHLRTAAGTLVPSTRLARELANAPRVSLTPKGFNPALFADAGQRTGELRIGWAGNARQPDKRVDIIISAAPDLQIASRDRPHEAMGEFFNSVDVVTCASDAEGDPLTLIEGMASGCMPVTVDVGIVPEIVMAGDVGYPIASGVTIYPRGIVVDRTVEAFSSAFAWCRANVDVVRAVGRRNAEHMLAERTWAQCAPAWGDAFERALARKE